MIGAVNSVNNNNYRPSFGMFVPARVVVRKANRGMWDFYTLQAADSRGARQSFIDYVKKLYAKCLADKAQGPDYKSKKNYQILKKLHGIPDFKYLSPNINTTEVVTGSDTRVWVLTGNRIDDVRELGAVTYRKGKDSRKYIEGVKDLVRQSKVLREIKTGESIGLDIIVDENNVVRNGRKVKKYTFVDLDVVPVISQYRQKQSQPMMVQGDLFAL